MDCVGDFVGLGLIRGCGEVGCGCEFGCVFEGRGGWGDAGSLLSMSVSCCGECGKKGPSVMEGKRCKGRRTSML